MQEGQNEIYYLFAPNRQLAEHSPYFEMFESQNREVLFAYEAADETVFLSLPQYRMKQLKSVDSWAKSGGTNEKSNAVIFDNDATDCAVLLCSLIAKVGCVMISVVEQNQ
uniref:Uncharacterized protein n=1 Tax=Parascaris equorum TaxID=6256 RepID=A0A914RU74_PAREQ